MMISAKPMSSPSRTDKFPPPLMRFLRSNVGSRSRGRSRSSPMFVRKKNAAIETQEPSSPKVTCIGQVVVRRSTGRRTKTPSRGRCSCWRVRKTLFCRFLAKRLRPKLFRPDWRKWVWFFRCGYCRRADCEDDSSKMESNRGGKYRAGDVEDAIGGEDEEEEDKVEVKIASLNAVISSTPPKNALLLTRCRSAPYRSSSLAVRFWGSPLESSEAEESKQQQVEDGEIGRPASEIGASPRDSTAESRNGEEFDGKSGDCGPFEGSVNGKDEETTSTQEAEAEKGGGVTGQAPPLTLTRCKSEPARKGERLNMEAGFWRNRRFGFAEPRS